MARGFQLGHPFGKRFKKGMTPWNKGISFIEIKGNKHPNWKGGLPTCSCGKTLASYYSEQCKSCYAKENLAIMSLKGKEGAKRRWEGHIRIFPKHTYKNSLVKRIKLTEEQLLEHKRFRNQRYKARKRLVVGNHTLNQWLLLKAKYYYMCLCCKKQEPEIKLSEDHIIPLSMGGSDNIDNIQPLCTICNTKKHAKTISYLPINLESLTLDYRREGVTN